MPPSSNGRIRWGTTPYSTTKLTVLWPRSYAVVCDNTNYKYLWTDYGSGFSWVQFELADQRGYLNEVRRYVIKLNDGPLDILIAHMGNKMLDNWSADHLWTRNKLRSSEPETNYDVKNIRKRSTHFSCKTSKYLLALFIITHMSSQKNQPEIAIQLIKTTINNQLRSVNATQPSQPS